LKRQSALLVRVVPVAAEVAVTVAIAAAAMEDVVADNYFVILFQ
jgi:hypothetical protein